MKQFLLFSVLLLITTMAMSQIKIANDGKVGVGLTTPAYKLDLKGTARFSLWGQSWDNIFLDGVNQWGSPQLYCSTDNFRIGTPTYPVSSVHTRYLNNTLLLANSDEELKENIKPLGSTLNKLLEIEGKSYNYKIDMEDCRIPELKEMLKKETFGFLAQELMKVFPELVYAPNSLNDHHSINYIGIIPILVEAIKEQQSQIEGLQKMMPKREYDIDLLLEQIDACCQKNIKNTQSEKSFIDENTQQEETETIYDDPIKSLYTEDKDISGEKSRLFQNVPNPFSIDTEIKFTIPENANSARLLIHDMQGAEIKSYIITQKGLGTIIVNGFELTAGMYLYTLLIDNKIIDTKRMILTK